MMKSGSVFKNRKKLGKKGFLQDIIFALAILFTFAISTYIALTIWNEYRDNTANTMEDTEAQRDIISNASRTLHVLDYAFLMLFMGLLISTIVTAFFIRSHPVMFVLSLILLFVVLLLAVVYANIFEKFEEQSSLDNATNTYRIIPEIMSGFPKYIFGFFILVALAFFAKAKMESGGL